MGIVERPKKKRNIKRALFIIGTLAIPILHFCVFYIYVHAEAFVMAFQRYDVNGNLYWTLENFEIVFKSFQSGGIGVEALRNTMIYYLIAVFQTLIIGPIFAYFSYKNLWGDTLRRVLGAGAGLMSGVVVTTIVSLLFEPGGPISKLFTNMYGLDMPAQIFNDSRFAMKGLIIYTVWWGLGINYYIRGAMMRIPEDVIEYAKLDGVSWIRELTSIILPLCWPTIMTLLILSSTSLLMSSSQEYLFTGGDYGTTTIAHWLWVQQLNAKPNSNSLYFVGALGMTLSFVTIPIVFGLRAILEKFNAKVEY